MQENLCFLVFLFLTFDKFILHRHLFIGACAHVSYHQIYFFLGPHQTWTFTRSTIEKVGKGVNCVQG